MELPEGLEAELMPKHVAVIMDGNRRWATNRKLPAQLGHRAGSRAMKQLTLNCSKFGVKVLLYLCLPFLLKTGLVPKNNVQISIIGNKSGLPPTLQSLIASYEAESVKLNRGMRIVVAVNYGGRYDITEASKKIATKVRDGVLQVEEINENIFQQHLETSGVEFSNPDLLIRTSGENRVSNFMLWQLAYSELLFVNKLFPDFDEEDLVEALRVFQKRQRRYGGHKY